MQQEAAKHLPQGYGYDWTAMSYQELQAAGQEAYAFAFAVVFSYLFLAALYESWTLPLSVVLPVVFALLGGLVALMVRGTALDVYAQIGLVLLIGLAAKNAVLIVEFSKYRLERGDVSLEQAGEEGARTRFRPVMMTAMAFIIGVIPLVVATGAGAGARQVDRHHGVRRHDLRGADRHPVRATAVRGLRAAVGADDAAVPAQARTSGGVAWRFPVASRMGLITPKSGQHLWALCRHIANLRRAARASS